MKVHADSAKERTEAMPGGGERRVLSYGGSMMAVRFDFGGGVTTEEHSHPHEQIGYVVSGEIVLFMGDSTNEHLTAGCSYYVAPGVRHHIETLKPTVVLDCFSPIREDFLNRNEESSSTA